MYFIVFNNIIFIIAKPYDTCIYYTFIVFDEYHIVKRYDNLSKYSTYYFLKNRSDHVLFDFINDKYIINKLVIEYSGNKKNLSSFTNNICTNESIAKTIEQNIINKINEIVVDEENQYIILEIF